MNPNSCYLSYSRKTPPKWKDMKLIKLCFFAFVHLCFFDKNRLLFSIFDISSILLICVRKCQIGDVRKGLVVKTEIAKNMHKNHYMAKCHFFYYGKRSNGKKKYQFANVNFCAIWYGIFLPFELPLAMFISFYVAYNVPADRHNYIW